MIILVIADPKIPVPPREYGGAERIVGYLCGELQRLGHQVHLMAGPGSQSFGGQLSLHYMPRADRISRALRKLWFQVLSFRASKNVDVILNFGRLDYLWSVLKSDKPLICCFQNPVTQAEVDWLIKRRKTNLQLVGISRNQVDELLPQELWNIVYNVADTERLKFNPSAATPPYLTFLGRITFNKGADTAIRVARRCGMKLKLAGPISDESGGRDFFEREIRPQLDDQIEWIGSVNDAAKQVLLGDALALLFPIRWPEPFGIVMVESLACGTPVIATRCASTPEVVDSGSTGFLCDSEEDLVGAVSRVSQIDRAACRRAAEEKFSVLVMTQGYLLIMQRLSEISKEVSE